MNQSVINVTMFKAVSRFVVGTFKMLGNWQKIPILMKNILQIDLKTFNTKWVQIMNSNVETNKKTINKFYKDLGVVFICSLDGYHYFEITNVKKWLFAKIKHGM